MSPECFYLLTDGEQRGPYTIAQIDHLLNSGLIHEQTTYWREGLEEWLPVTNLVRLRRQPRSWMKRGVLAGFLIFVLVLVQFLGPTILEGWREAKRYDEFTPAAAYWTARDVVRHEAAPAGAALSFGTLATARIELTQDSSTAKVWLPAVVSFPRAEEKAMAWDLQLAFDRASKTWSRVSVQEAKPR